MSEEAKKLYDMLKKVQEPKGYFFNKDLDMTLDLMEGLLLNKQRYGYMCCPCRMASGDRTDRNDSATLGPTPVTVTSRSNRVRSSTEANP